MIRNALIAITTYVGSIFLVNLRYKQAIDESELKKDTLGTLAIDDFDTAMKSNLPVKYFRNFLNVFTDYTRLEPVIPQVRNAKLYF